MRTSVFQTVDKPRIIFFRGDEPRFVFSATGASKKLLISGNPHIKRVSKGAGVVLAGIECSPKIFDFRANGIPVQERVDFFDTLKGKPRFPFLLYVHKYEIEIYIPFC